MSRCERAVAQSTVSYLLGLLVRALANHLTSLLRAWMLGSRSSLRKLLCLDKNSVNLPARLIMQRENFLGEKKLAVLNVATLSEPIFSARSAFTY